MQNLVAKSLRLMFRGSTHGLTTTTVMSQLCPDRRFSVVAAAGGWSSLSGALICVARWWATHSQECHGAGDETPSCNEGVDALPSFEAVSLARAVAEAYASAVEQFQVARSMRALAMPVSASGPAYSLSIENTLGERAGVTMAPSLHWAQGFDGRLPAPAASIATASVPRRFKTAVLALSSVPCAQPELVRALRAVVGRSPQTPFAALWRGEPGGWNRAGGGLVGSTDQGPAVEQSAVETLRSSQATARDMAPPPPREPAGKKRKVILGAEGLRAAASGRDGESDGNADQGQPSTAAGNSDDATDHRQGHNVVDAEEERTAVRDWPSMLSGYSGALEAVDAVLSRARRALDFFQAESEEDSVANDLDGEGGGDGDGGAVYSEGRSSVRPLLMQLLQHTAAVTCALRVLTPLTEGARQGAPREDAAGGRRLNFGTRLQKETTRFDVRAEHRDGAKTRDPLTLEANRTPPEIVIRELAGGFVAAVRAVARYKAGGSNIYGREIRSVACVDDESPSSSAWKYRALAWLWEMLVNCAAELPVDLLAAPDRSDINSASGAVDQLETRTILLEAIGVVAEKSMETVVLNPNSSILEAALKEPQDTYQLNLAARRDPLSAPGCNATAAAAHNRTSDMAARSLWVPGLAAPHDDEDVREGSGKARAGTTVLGPRAPSAAPLPLKCFLLVAAFANGWGKGKGSRWREARGGKGENTGAAVEGSERPDDLSTDSQDFKDQERTAMAMRARREAHREDGSRGEGEGEDKRGVNAVDAKLAVAEEALLAGIRGRRDGVCHALVTQSAVAALPYLSLCTCGNLRASEGDHDLNRPSGHARYCNWRTLWLPALLALLEKEAGSPEEESIRLELAAGSLRLGESLLRGLTDPVAAVAAGDSAVTSPQPPLACDDDDAGPNAFEDLLPLWPRLLGEKTPAVRAASARAALLAASAAPLPRLKASGAAGVQVLELLVGMLACGDPEVAWVVAGGAGRFVAQDGKLLRALYAPGGRRGVQAGETDGAEGDSDEGDVEEDEEDTLGQEEEVEREGRLRELALSRFIESVGAKLQELGDRLRRGRWQSLHEFTGLLRALG